MKAAHKSIGFDLHTTKDTEVIRSVLQGEEHRHSIGFQKNKKYPVPVFSAL
jgi:hypothetical protein